MFTIKFYGFTEIANERLKYAVIVARLSESWVFVRHRERDTWEIPGGHREHGEHIDYTAKRELYEETGAEKFDIRPVCVYSVSDHDCKETFGGLFFAQLGKLGKLPDLEIAEIIMSPRLPDRLTYPAIQPLLFDKVRSVLGI